MSLSLQTEIPAEGLFNSTHQSALQNRFHAEPNESGHARRRILEPRQRCQWRGCILISGLSALTKLSTPIRPHKLSLNRAKKNSLARISQQMLCPAAQLNACDARTKPKIRSKSMFSALPHGVTEERRVKRLAKELSDKDFPADNTDGRGQLVPFYSG